MARFDVHTLGWTSVLCAALLTLACTGAPAEEDDFTEPGQETIGRDAGRTIVRRPDAGLTPISSSSSLETGGSSSSSGSPVGTSSSIASSSLMASSSSSSSSGGISSSTSVVMSSSSSAMISSSSTVAVPSSSSSGPMSSSSSVGMSSSSSAMPPPELIYVHTSERLFLMDAQSRALTDLGAFEFVTGTGAALSDQGMLDIAVKSTGEVLGISADYTGSTTRYHLVRIDVINMEARRLGTVSKFTNALTFAPAAMVYWPEEALLAIGGGSSQYSDVEILNETTGQSRLLMNIDPWDDLDVSGDVVAVDGVGILATAYDSNDVEWLVELDGYDGTATKKPNPLGFSDVWGLAYWGGTLYGFTGGGTGTTPQGRILTINIQTGVATQVAVSSGNSFFGAAVTPYAPTTP